MAKKIFIIAMILLILAAIMLCAMLVIRIWSCGGNIPETPDTNTEGVYEFYLADWVVMDNDPTAESAAPGAEAETDVPPDTASLMFSAVHTAA